MNWEAIGAIGEILGATVVVVTIFYLARQTKQSVELNRVAEQRILIDQGNTYFRITIDPENLAAIRKGFRSYRNLSRDEQAKVFIVFLQWLNHYEKCMYAHDAGMLPKPVMIAFKNFALSILVTAGGKEFWEDMGPAVGQDLQDSINGALLSGQLPGPVTETFHWLRDEDT
ncbi:MAG: hypothetical protein ACI9IQ_001141 [Cyclobacteriaceae bacterium]|jgi:hypothetical protein